jgi:hypothetical protein
MHRDAHHFVCVVTMEKLGMTADIIDNVDRTREEDDLSSVSVPNAILNI